MFDFENSSSCIRRGRAGFTLVELLAAVLILAMGVGLVAGIGENVLQDSRIDETRNIQAVALKALATYYKTTGTWPAGNGEPDSGANLLTALRRAGPETKNMLQRLPQCGRREDNTGTVHLLDGFGNRMLYFQTGGLAGSRPLLMSKGADQADTTDDILGETEPEMTQ